MEDLKVGYAIISLVFIIALVATLIMNIDK